METPKSKNANQGVQLTLDLNFSTANVENQESAVKKSTPKKVDSDKINFPNLQLYPSKELVIATDKMKKNVFNPTKQSVNRAIIEDKKSGIKTPLTIEFSDFNGKQNITLYDELVFDICVSEQFKGNQYTTLAIIHRAVGGSKTNFTAKEKDRILQSIHKLATTWIKFDCSNTFKKFGYNDGKAFEYSGALLPCEFIKASVNGQTDSAVIHFLRKSPLLDVAMFKGQFITCDINLLDVPNIKNTEQFLTLKSYLSRRVLQIVGSHKPHKKHFAGKKQGGGFTFRQAKQLKPIILLDTLFEQCGLKAADRFKQRDARNIVTKIMNHFKEQKLITEWYFEKVNGKYYSIKLAF